MPPVGRVPFDLWWTDFGLHYGMHHDAIKNYDLVNFINRLLNQKFNIHKLSLPVCFHGCDTDVQWMYWTYVVSVLIITVNNWFLTSDDV